MKKTLTLNEASPHLQALINHLDQMEERTAAQTGFLNDLHRLQELLKTNETAEPTLADINASLFPGSTPESSRTAFAAFRREIKNTAQVLGHTLELCKENQRGKTPAQVRCHFEGVALNRLSDIDQATKKAIAGLDSLPMVEALAAGFTEKERQELIPEFNPDDDKGRTTVRLFISYAHDNDKLVVKLLDRLKQELNISAEHSFQIWSDKGLLTGSIWDQTIKNELAASDLCLSLLSPAFFNSTYILENELPPVVSQTIPGIPVMLEPLNFGTQNLQGIEQTQIFRLPKNSELRAYSQCRGEVAKTFAAELAQQIETLTPSALSRRAQSRILEALSSEKAYHRFITKYPRVLDILAQARKRQKEIKPIHQEETTLSYPSRESLTRLLESTVSLDGDETLLEALAACSDLEKLDSVTGKDSNPDYDQLRSKQDSALRIMTNWLADPEAAPFAAVLGEVGSGKTTMLKMLASRLSKTRKAPAVIFVDLRDYLHTDEMTLENILGEHLRRHDNDQTLTVANLLHAVQKENALIIFDGLDEKIISLSDAARRSFINELWRVLPPGKLSAEEQQKRGRLVISCRSHYFPSVQAQSSGYLDSDRSDGVTGKDYLTCIMLPWESEQIESYLAQAIGEENVEKALQVISEVHNLSDLAQRPYLLSLITPELESLEQEKAQNRPVNAAVLYKKFTERWLLRDDGKHVFTARHKGLLMQALAAALWQEQAREWPWEEVEDWLDDFLLENPAIALNYQNLDPALLRQDLRTATFFVRPDSSDSSFRFAHTSLQEYFLAEYLVSSLKSNKAAQAWNLPLPSLETFDFVGQMLEKLPDQKREKSLSSLSFLLADKDSPIPVREAIFRYYLHLRKRLRLTPTLTAVNLSGIDLGHLRLSGDQENPLILPKANFNHSLLNASHFEHVVFAGGSLWREADLRGSEFFSCNLNEADFQGAKAEGAPPIFRYCHVEKANLPTPYTSWLEKRQIPERSSIPHCSAQPDSGNAGGALTASFSPDGKFIVSASVDNSLILRDAFSGLTIRSLLGHSDWVLSAAFSPDSRFIVSTSSDHSLIVWNALTGKIVHSLAEQDGIVRSAVFSPDGKYIISASNDSSLILWDAHLGQMIRSFKGHSDWVLSATFSPDGKYIISSSRDKSLILWDALSGQIIRSFKGHSDWVLSAKFSPNGKYIISSSRDKSLILWDVLSGQTIRSFEGHSEYIRSVVFSPGGEFVLSASNDHSLMLWDVFTGRTIRSFKGHSDWALSADFSPDGKFIISTSNDNTLILWDAHSGQIIRSFKEHSELVQSASFSSEKKSISAKYWKGNFTHWNIEGEEVKDTYISSADSKYSQKSLHRFSLLARSRFLLKRDEKRDDGSLGNRLVREIIPLCNGTSLVIEPWDEDEAKKSYQDCRWKLVSGPKDAWRYLNAIDRETNTLYPAEYATEDGTWEIIEPLSES